MGVIDLHCHVLPGIDDGPSAIEGSIALGRAAVQAGIRVIVATPHVNSVYLNDAETIGRRTEEVNAAFADESLALEVLPGAEIASSRIADLEPVELAALALGEGPWLLIECPFAATAAGIDVLLLYLRNRGHRIVLAHPERCPAFHREPQMLGSLVRSGVLASITAGSLVGRFGEPVRRFALRLAQEGMIHNVASDAHDHVHRPPGIAKELERAGLGSLTEWLTREVPVAILTGAEIPPRPTVALSDIRTPRRRWWRRGSTISAD